MRSRRRGGEEEEEEVREQEQSVSGREREIEAHTEIEKSSPDRLAERLDSIESREEVVDGIPHSQSEGLWRSCGVC